MAQSPPASLGNLVKLQFLVAASLLSFLQKVCSLIHGLFKQALLQRFHPPILKAAATFA